MTCPLRGVTLVAHMIGATLATFFGWYSWSIFFYSTIAMIAERNNIEKKNHPPENIIVFRILCGDVLKHVWSLPLYVSCKQLSQPNKSQEWNFYRNICPVDASTLKVCGKCGLTCQKNKISLQVTVELSLSASDRCCNFTWKAYMSLICELFG